MKHAEPMLDQTRNTCIKTREEATIHTHKSVLWIWLGTLTSVRFDAMIQVLTLRDVLMWDQEQNHLALLVLYGHDVQQAPELGPFLKKRTHTHHQCRRAWAAAAAASGRSHPHRSSCREWSRSWTPAARPERSASARWGARWSRCRTGSGTCSSSASARRGRSRSVRRSHRSSRRWGKGTGPERSPGQNCCLGVKRKQENDNTLIFLSAPPPRLQSVDWQA